MIYDVLLLGLRQDKKTRESIGHGKGRGPSYWDAADISCWWRGRNSNTADVITQADNVIPPTGSSTREFKMTDEGCFFGARMFVVWRDVFSPDN